MKKEASASFFIKLSQTLNNTKSQEVLNESIENEVNVNFQFYRLISLKQDNLETFSQLFFSKLS